MFSEAYWRTSGGNTPCELSSVNIPVKKGIIVKSDDVSETLWAWILKVLVPSTKIFWKLSITNLSGYPPT